jgi:hypothetical protein
MTRLKINLKWDDPFYKNDAIELPCVVNAVISTWKIRAEVFDKSGNCVKLATSTVTGGSDDQIEITDGTNGKFTVKISNGDTDCFDDKSFIEIEREDASGNLRTIVRRKFALIEDEIEWSDNV